MGQLGQKVKLSSSLGNRLDKNNNNSNKHLKFKQDYRVRLPVKPSW